MRLFSPVAIALLTSLSAACPGDGAELPEPTPPSSTWGDPVELLDTYGGPTFSELGEVVAHEDRVYFCSGIIGMNVYDATDPSDLRSLARIGFSLGSFQYPRCQHLAVDGEGDRVYVANRANSVQRVSFLGVADTSGLPDSPIREAGVLELEESPEGLTVHGDLLLVAAHDAGLLIYRRGAGAELTELSRVVEGLDNAWDVQAVGDLAYVVDGVLGLVTIDIAAPDAPQVLATLPLPGASKDLVVDGDRAFVAAGTAGLALISLDDPRAPALIEVEDSPGAAVAVAWGGSANAVYLADWNSVRIYDLTDRDDAVPRGHEPLPLTTGGVAGDSRTLGIGAAEDVFFSGNWTELVSYRYFPGREAPDIEADALELNLADTEVGGERFATVRLRNSGTRPLTLFSGATEPEELEVVEFPEGAVLAPGEEESLRVRFRPISDLPVSGEIRARSDDPDEPELRIPVLANRPGAGVGDPAVSAVYLTLEGEEVDLDALRGSPVLLAYFATF